MQNDADPRGHDDRPQRDDAQSCDEYRRLSRRHFLGQSALAGLGAFTAPLWAPGIARAAGAGAPRGTLVYVFLRGAMDGLSVCVPHGDGDYYEARPTLAVPKPGQTGGAIDLDGFFGLNAAAQPLLGSYGAGRLALVNAVGSHDPTRSHFEAFSKVEFGIPNLPLDAADSGWLARHMQAAPPAAPGATLRGVAINDLLPLTLAQAPQTIPVPEPANFEFPGIAATAAKRRQAIQAAYTGALAPMNSTAKQTFGAIDLFASLGLDGYLPEAGVEYPDTDLGAQLRAAAALIKADVGLESISIDFGSWDHHAGQGPVDGLLASMLDELARALAAFDLDTLPVSDRVTLVAHSEFGRRVAQNGSAGTDHGHGGLMFVMGGAVNGGQVWGTWPGLAEAQLDQGDLAVTTDYRDVLGEILLEQLGATTLDTVFPGLVHAPLGLIG